jgi:hypothetical protein
VVLTAVGTMTFHASEINQAMLNYAVNGTSIVKQIQRQNLVTLDFAGNYQGMLSQLRIRR